jgi:hypothetical protein
MMKITIVSTRDVLVWIILIPYTINANPTEERIIDKTSILGFVISIAVCKKILPPTIQKIINGIKRKNRALQVKNCSTIPDTMGPSEGPTRMVLVHRLIERPCFSGGLMHSTVLTIIGINRPVPTACTILAANKIGNLAEMAANTVPMRKRDIAPTYNCLVVKVRRRNAVAGTMIATTKTYPVDSHWIVVAVTFSSTIILLRATFSMVSLKRDKEPPNNKNTIIAVTFSFLLLRYDMN